MLWRMLARVLDHVRVVLAVGSACVFTLYILFGPLREFADARVIVLAVCFAVALAVAIVALTALLAVAEHKAELAELAANAPKLPTAIAGYRDPRLTSSTPPHRHRRP